MSEISKEELCKMGFAWQELWTGEELIILCHEECAMKRSECKDAILCDGFFRHKSLNAPVLWSYEAGDTCEVVKIIKDGTTNE